MAGDIIWAVNGKTIGGEIVCLDKALNKVANNTAQVTIYREDQLLDINVTVYKSNQHDIKRMVSFGGALFFETDLAWSDKLGVPPGSLSFHSVDAGTTFKASQNHPILNKGLFYGIIEKIDHEPVLTLDDLIDKIPALIEKGVFSIHYQTTDGKTCYSAMKYKEMDPEPKIFVCQKNGSWEKNTIQ